MHVNKKPLARNANVTQTKNYGLERTINGFEKSFRTKSRPKIEKKTSKNSLEISACEQKTTSKKPSFYSITVFTLFLKIRAKKYHVTKPLAFSLHFMFRRDQNHYCNMTSNIMKKCAQIRKKDKDPIQFKFFEL